MSTDAVSTLVIFIESMRSPLARRARSGSRPLRPLAALARGRVPSVRSLRSLGVASPLSARCARVRISPLRGSARTPALGEASGTLRSACASVGPPRRRQPGGYGVVAASRFGQGRFTGMPRPGPEGQFREAKNGCPSPSRNREKDRRYGRCRPTPRGMEASVPRSS